VSKNFKIYGLTDKNETIRYIGLTSKSLEKRLKQHKQSSRNKFTHKANWIKQQDYKIDIILLEDNLTKEEAIELEIAYIVQYGRDNLTNATDGGEGVKGYLYTLDDLKNWYSAIPICQYDLTGKFIKSFPSISIAARELNLGIDAINKCVNENSITSYGYFFIKNDDKKEEVLARKLKDNYNYKLVDIEGNIIAKSNTIKYLTENYPVLKNSYKTTKQCYYNNGVEKPKTKYFILHKSMDEKIFAEKNKRIIVYDIHCNKIGTYANSNIAAKYLKANPSSINNCVSGRRKSFRGNNKQYIAYYIGKKCKQYKHARWNSVALVDEKSKILQVYKNAKLASYDTGCDPSVILKCCKKERKQTKGKYFKFLNDIV